MKRLMRIKFILGILAIFLAGSVFGGFFGARLQKESSRVERKLENFEENILAYLTEKLSLTESQIERVRPLIAQACQELRQIHEESSEKVESVIRKYHEKIAGELDPEQVEIIQKLEHERRCKAGTL